MEMTEFLVRIEIALPAGLDDEEREALVAAEARRGRELTEAGQLRRIWRIPGRHANVGLWEAADATALHALLASLPMFVYMDIDVTALATHPLEGGEA
ncbi:MAG TPA: muconolactone Delta-isomerase family protein [Solirubrobacterales bacterium]|nr:muconolactone Delta-isomerase family protein [Solirubrobacterales bacterium]